MSFELDNVIQEPVPSSDPSLIHLSGRGRRIIGIFLRFLLGQGALQGIQILAGLFLLRRLSVEAYAQFSLAYGFQVTMGILMDLGLTSSIVPLVGENREDCRLVGRYVRSAKHMRDQAFWILAPVATIAFLAIMYKHHWSWQVQVMLLLSVLFTLHSSGRVSYYSSPLFIFGRLREYYVPQTLSAFGRLVAYVSCSFAGVLNSSIAAGLNAMNVAVNSAFLKRNAHKYMEWPEHDDPQTDREVLRYILPATPATILAAFQSQISLFLISVFGGTANIAEVAALGRLGQFFAVLMTFNIVVIEPYIARLSREQLARNYFGFIAGTTMVCIPLVIVAFAFPAPFLWLLGANYKNLGSVVGWVITAACINHVSGMMWIMNRSRKWLFWSGSILEVVLLLTVQIAFIAFIGVHTTRQAVLLTFASSFCYVAAHGYVGVYGFLKSSRPKEVG